MAALSHHRNPVWVLLSSKMAPEMSPPTVQSVWGPIAAASVLSGHSVQMLSWNNFRHSFPFFQENSQFEYTYITLFWTPISKQPEHIPHHVSAWGFEGQDGRDCCKLQVSERFCSAGRVNCTVVWADGRDQDTWAGMRLCSPSLSYPLVGC